MTETDRAVGDFAEASNGLRRLLVDTAEQHGLSMNDVTVLAAQNDPFRLDTPTNHRDGEWLATHVERLGLERAIHLRGLHYLLVTDAPAKPNGQTYSNTNADWKWLYDKAADAARWLGYIPFDRIIDRRNAEPITRVLDRYDPWPYLHVGIDVDIPDAADLEPKVDVLYFTGVQPYRLVLIGEKSSLADVLEPIANAYQADLYLPTGEISDTQIHRLAKAAAADGRPMVVLYFSDADPSGWQMPISVGRKLQAFKAAFYPDLDFEEYRVALTPDQVRQYAFAINAAESLGSARRPMARGDRAGTDRDRRARVVATGVARPARPRGDRAVLRRNVARSGSTCRNRLDRSRAGDRR